jgi:hypothetical protein
MTDFFGREWRMMGSWMVRWGTEKSSTGDQKSVSRSVLTVMGIVGELRSCGGEDEDLFVRATSVQGTQEGCLQSAMRNASSDLC